jgi:hypothetical protein
LHRTKNSGRENWSAFFWVGLRLLFGPPVEMRSSPEELKQKLSFTPMELIEVGEHFYMQLFVKM